MHGLETIIRRNEEAATKHEREQALLAALRDMVRFDDLSEAEQQSAVECARAALRLYDRP